MRTFADMKLKELNNTLRSEARFLGLCDEWYNEWKDYSEDELAERMYKGIDFCLKHHWPSNEFIAKNFKAPFLITHGILVDTKWSFAGLRNGLFLGASTATLRYSGRQYGNVAVRDTTKVTVYARGAALVVFHLFEKAYIHAEVSEKARVVFIMHSKEARVDAVTLDGGASAEIKEEYDYLK